MLEEVIEQHKEQFDRQPVALAADIGFYPDTESYGELNKEIEFLKVPSSCREYSDKILSEAQKFRAGIEDTISYLKGRFAFLDAILRDLRTFHRLLVAQYFAITF